MPLQPSNSILIASITIAAASVGLSLVAQDAQSAAVQLSTSQQTLLKSQLIETYKCDMAEILFSRELELGGNKQLEGRVRCRDQREVDFSQSDPNQRFELRLCRPTVC
mgnify:CR=1 FL=1